MGFSKLSSIILIALIATGLKNLVEMVQGKLDTSSTPELAVSISTSFPSSSDALGIKIFNGHRTDAVLEFTNSEAEPIIVSSVKAALLGLQAVPTNAKASAGQIHNLSSASYNVAIPAGEKRKIPFTFTTNFYPQDFQMNIAANISYREGTLHQVQAFDETVTVLDPATSIFDPQILFLYTILIAIAGASAFWLYKSWIQPLMPQAKRGVKSSEPAKRSHDSGVTAVSSVNQKSAVTSSTAEEKAYDESWIPEHHIKKTTTKRGKTGSTKK